MPIHRYRILSFLVICTLCFVVVLVNTCTLSHISVDCITMCVCLSVCIWVYVRVYVARAITHVCEIHEILTSIRCTHILPSNHVLANFSFLFFGESLNQFNQFDIRFSMKFKIVSFQLKQKFATPKKHSFDLRIAHGPIRLHPRNGFQCSILCVCFFFVKIKFIQIEMSRYRW